MGQAPLPEHVTGMQSGTRHSTGQRAQCQEAVQGPLGGDGHSWVWGKGTGPRSIAAGTDGVSRDSTGPIPRGPNKAGGGARWRVYAHAAAHERVLTTPKAQDRLIRLAHKEMRSRKLHIVRGHCCASRSLVSRFSATSPAMAAGSAPGRRPGSPIAGYLSGALISLPRLRVRNKAPGRAGRPPIRPPAYAAAPGHVVLAARSPCDAEPVARHADPLQPTGPRPSPWSSWQPGPACMQAARPGGCVPLPVTACHGLLATGSCGATLLVAKSRNKKRTRSRAGQKRSSRCGHIAPDPAVMAGYGQTRLQEADMAQARAGGSPDGPRQNLAKARQALREKAGMSYYQAGETLCPTPVTQPPIARAAGGRKTAHGNIPRLTS